MKKQNVTVTKVELLDELLDDGNHVIKVTAVLSNKKWAKPHTVEHFEPFLGVWNTDKDFAVGCIKMKLKQIKKEPSDGLFLVGISRG